MNEKIDVGNVLERTFKVYGEQFSLLIPAALVLFIPVAIIEGLVLSAGGVLASLLAAAIGVVATFWFQGMVVEAVNDIMDGRRDHTVGTLLRSAIPVIWPLFAVGIVAGICIAIGFVLIIVPGLYLLTIWAVVAPVIVIERAGIFASLGRSRELVKGNGWQVFGVIVVLFLIGLILGAVLGAITASVADSLVGRSIAQLISRVLVGPLSGIAAAVLYFQLKGAGSAAVEGYGDPAPPAPPAAPEAPTQTQPAPAAPPQSTPAPPQSSPPPPQSSPPPPPVEGGQGQPGRPPEPGEPGGGPPPDPERPQQP
jgi:hypothetical protein